MPPYVADADPDGAWHALPLTAVMSKLDASKDGLSAAAARDRLASAGPNAMPSAPPTSRWRVLIGQMRSVIVLLLLFACVVAAVAGEVADTIVIAAVLVLNVGMGYAVEIKAHRAIEALARLEARRATVVRDGLPSEIDARQVVPGDVLVLEAGQSVAADARLLMASELRVMEAALTGEPIPVTKQPMSDVDADAPLPDRRNMVYAGTSVVVGAGHALVVTTGAQTELGTIGRLVSSTPVEPTPLERRLDTLGRQLVWAALFVGAVTGVLAWVQHAPFALVLQTAIALAVAAVPEGLPAVATITLALGVRRMARRHALVRRLPSVETLGAVTVICSDKTGTLTTGAMTVTQVRTASRTYGLTGEGYAPEGTFTLDGQSASPEADPDLVMALRIAVAANRADAVLSGSEWVSRGDPTEAALVVAARKAGLAREDVLDGLAEIGEVPFSSDRKLMATFHRTPSGKTIAFVKGSPPKVLGLCESVLERGSAHPLSDITRHEILESNRDMASRALRVLALAFGQVDRLDEAGLGRLTFVGLAGMQDPPAPGVLDAIRAFKNACVRTVMITGDQRGTAVAIARDLELADANSGVLDGREIDSLSDEALADGLEAVTVFSRVSPEAKLRIVAAFQKDGEIVAMLGDGVNDAAALKKADVGVTMGRRGTDVAREAAAVVLQDDRFETIGVAIEEGRIVFDNIRKFVFYLFSCNLAEIIVLLGAGATGLALPLLPIHVLWLNLVTDTIPALALATEPGTGDVMRRPPREPGAEILSRPFVHAVLFYGFLVALPVFFVMAWNALTDVPAGRAITMNFMVLAFAQLLHLGNARDERAVLHPRRVVANRMALGAVIFTIAIQVLTILSPSLRAVLRLEVLTPFDWLVVALASLVPAVAGQALKLAGRNP